MTAVQYSSQPSTGMEPTIALRHLHEDVDQVLGRHQRIHRLLTRTCHPRRQFRRIFLSATTMAAMAVVLATALLVPGQCLQGQVTDAMAIRQAVEAVEAALAARL